MRGLMTAQPTLNPARFSALGYSEYRPIASNDTDEGRAQNRRVEVFIARSMRYSGDTTSSTSNGQATASESAPSTMMPASTGLPGGTAAGTSARPIQGSPGIVPEPLQH